MWQLIFTQWKINQVWLQHEHVEILLTKKKKKRVELQINLTNHEQKPKNLFFLLWYISNFILTWKCLVLLSQSWTGLSRSAWSSTRGTLSALWSAKQQTACVELVLVVSYVPSGSTGCDTDISDLAPVSRQLKLNPLLLHSVTQYFRSKSKFLIEATPALRINSLLKAFN